MKKQRNLQNKRGEYQQEDSKVSNFEKKSYQKGMK